MFEPRPRRFALVAAVLALVASSACKKKPVEEVKKDIVKKVEITEAPLPDGAVGELVIKDPEGFLKKVSAGAGMESMVGASPYQKLLDTVTDENAKKALKAIDPHGSLAAIALYKLGAPGEKPHGVVAARLKDADVASQALEAATKAGADFKSWDSKALGGKAYEGKDGGEVAVYGDVVIVSDTRDALESAGKYVAWRSVKSTIDHELTLRVPMDKMGPELKKLGAGEWAKVKPTDIPPKVKSEMDPLVEPVLGAVADMGQLAIHFDVAGDDLKVDETLGAKGSFGAWLGKYPTGDASPLLSMPKAENVALYRVPDGLGPLTYALSDYALDTSPLSTADRAEASKQIRALGKSLGHVVAYATDSGKGTPAAAPGAPPALNTEVYIRIDLDDAAAAKTAVGSLRKMVDKAFPSAKKLTAAPYKKNGAEGETITTPATIPGMGASPSSATKDTWTWAIKGSQLHLDVCLGCAPAMLDNALDPASKLTLGDDPAAKAKLEGIPAKGIVSASYGTSLSMPGMMGGLGAFMGAPPAPKKPGAAMWGYSVADGNGIVAKGAVPLAFVGDLAKNLLAIAAGGMLGGGMGGPPPPF